ncbi:Hypothetical predicted protein [Pelobates cultripes]|uniref:ribonuclease H n=1 Tax=Pelobates cultripes TaxID=61616 RepID=A0AAD1RZ37_PELCU|nr:Hypothetical predicted protein [Pelobates cultripes]
MLKSVVTHLWTHGVRHIIYLDDILIFDGDRRTLQDHKVYTVQLLESLGFVFNRAKSALEHSQTVPFLGFDPVTTSSREDNTFKLSIGKH